MARIGRVLGYDVTLECGENEGKTVQRMTMTLRPTWRTPIAVGWALVCRAARKLFRRP